MHVECMQQEHHEYSSDNQVVKNTIIYLALNLPIAILVVYMLCFRTRVQLIYRKVFLKGMF